MNSSRITNTKKNILWSYIDYFITFLFQFVSRTIIIFTLGSEYLGLSSLFSSILQILNMAELGFSTAIIYNLYKPIAENDTDAICALLAFYRKIYRIVGGVILAAGLAVMPFLPQLIKGTYPDTINLYFLYLLYLSSVVVSYYIYAYKTALLNALQRMDLTKIAYSIINIVQCVFQIVVLLVFRNYYLFVVGTVLGNALKNYLAGWFAKRYFPQYVCRGAISDPVKKSIWKRVKGLLVCRISGVTYNTFDSIIISSMLGLVPVAVYNNYYTVYNAVVSIIMLIRHSMQASVGNSVASESVEKNYHDVFLWQFLFSCISIICSACLLCLYQPFMLLWMGPDMMLTRIDTIIFSLLFTVSTVQHAFYLYLSAKGLWWELRWPYILSTVTNIILNILLCKLWGATGIILATLIAQFVFGMIWQCLIIFRVYFQKSAAPYFRKQLIYFLAGAFICLAAFYLCEWTGIPGIPGLLLRLLICLTVPPAMLLLFFSKTEAFRQSRQLFRRLLRRKERP